MFLRCLDLNLKKLPASSATATATAARKSSSS
jgi:hypothetical protein